MAIEDAGVCPNLREVGALESAGPPSLRPLSSFLNLVTVSCNNLTSSHPSSRSSTTARFLVFFAPFAYLRVLTVSAAFHSVRLTQSITRVCALPPSESCSNRLSLESRYATYEAVRDLTLEGSLRAEMTFPRARSPLLIKIPSLIRSPWAAVRFNW